MLKQGTINYLNSGHFRPTSCFSSTISLRSLFLKRVPCILFFSILELIWKSLVQVPRVPYPVSTIAFPYVFNFAYRHSFVKNCQLYNFQCGRSGCAPLVHQASRAAYSFFKHFKALCSMLMITNYHGKKEWSKNLKRGCIKLNIC
jgi:hypothetical protein